MRLRVPSGFLLAAAFLWLSEPSLQSLLISIPISAAGLMLRAWAAGHLAKNQELASSGPYAYTRNPLYLGTLITALGLAFAARRTDLAAMLVFLFVFVYVPVMQQEEMHLRKLFRGYGEYAERVPLLLPRGRITGDTAAFSSALYRRNEEYKALAGYLVALAVLFAKAYFT